ncbi:MAG: hypothetical protein HN833_03115 [Elusimicrobiaceae bacterium]|jgi:hypothetical protein|nr:hypothetical protein [Elusimicrobiaceae bacterium]MBT3954647.1 hypothetical protein [Elusimicrobiaceae bacterium]MBT4007955.1 hypothetical protein [Elusimicrobiaceae bacterium]MBT4403294.1 hypothetical protein [Elusimicrobiaceae bacterium]MBT4439969.1 hypothetical protein [Elusimicrobiaceae bacterium]
MKNYIAHLGRQGQILLPAVLLIPTILLAIYLIYETAKLSREKIRNQFAIDTAAFTEMTIASTFINASAYSSAAFPYRGLGELLRPDEKVLKPEAAYPDEVELSLYDYVYRAGGFPAMEEPGDKPKADAKTWKLEYYTGTRDDWMKEPPEFDEDTVYIVGSEEMADTHKVTKEYAINALKTYLVVYYKLGNIFKDQKTVYEKLSKHRHFFKKAYFLNAITCKEARCGEEAISQIKNFNVKLKQNSIKNVKIYFKSESGGIRSVELDLTEPFVAGVVDGEEIKETLGELFQFASLESGFKSRLKKMRKGIGLTQSFEAPKNYFNVNLKKYKPRVKVKVALQCTDKDNSCVWPESTPKYQVRTYP